MKKQMVNCDNGHDEIWFEGYFRVLCPLCQAREQAREQAETDALNAQDEAKADTEEQVDSARMDAKKEADDLNNQIKALQEENSLLRSDLNDLL